MKKRIEFLSNIAHYRQVYTWIAIFVLFMISASRHSNFIASLVITIMTMIPMIVLSETLRRLLIPRFLHRTRWLYYTHSFLTIAILTFLAVSVDIKFYRFIYINHYMNVPEDVREAIVIGKTPLGLIYLYAKYLILFSITMTVVTISHMLDERKRLEQMAKDQQMLQELKYLRAQINPHFLFNALNCIYSLSLIQDEKTSDSILMLSEMMRYVIDDCRSDYVSLSKEVSYINNYIEFQKIRMENEPNLTFECKIENESFSIPPMVFQPMVENCFKHSRIIDDPNAYINISLCQDGNNLTFMTTNSKHVNRFEQKDEERTGIGINNVRQRLDLLFGNKYAFNITEDENTFRTKLVITT